jgi:hypothetical protein
MSVRSVRADMRQVGDIYTIYGFSQSNFMLCSRPSCVQFSKVFREHDVSTLA